MEKYQIIYADPPWQYKVYSKKGEGRSAESHYSTMSIEDICRLPVEKIADKDSILFMWMTFPTLKEGLKVIEAWGFKYKTVAFVWIKQNRKTPSLFWGMGFWTRANAEICILATKGNPKRNEARERIVELVGDLKRIELFARQKVNGWDTWGDEIECDIDLSEYGDDDK